MTIDKYARLYHEMREPPDPASRDETMGDIHPLIPLHPRAARGAIRIRIRTARAWTGGMPKGRVAIGG